MLHGSAASLLGPANSSSVWPTLPAPALALSPVLSSGPLVIPTRVRSTLLSSADRRAHVGSGSRTHVTVSVTVMWGPCANVFLTPHRVCIPVLRPTLSAPLNAIAGQLSSATIAIPSAFDSEVPGFVDKTHVRRAIPNACDRLLARAINLVTGEWRKEREREREGLSLRRFLGTLLFLLRGRRDWSSLAREDRVGVLNLVCAPPASTEFLADVGWRRGFTSSRGRAAALHHSGMGTSFKVHSCSHCS
jgi:hypothetical protein